MKYNILNNIDTIHIKLFAIVSFIVFVISVYSVFGFFTTNNINKLIDVNINNTQTHIKNSLEDIINERKQFALKRSKVIFSNKELLNALELKNRAKFYKIINKHFKRMQKVEENFWGLHIILPNNMSFIRVHKPQAADNMIEKGKKPLIDYVNKTQQMISSFDDGKFGYFQRVVVPIFSANNKYLGAAEFSTNIDEITNNLKKSLKHEIRFLVKNINNKTFLNNLPKTKDGLVEFKSTNSELFNTSKQKDHMDVIKYNNKVFKIFKLELSKTAILEVAFDITQTYNQELDFITVNKIALLTAIVVSGIIWALLIFTVLKLKEGSERLVRKEIQLDDAMTIAKLGVWKFDILNNDLAWSDEIYKIFEIDRDKFQPSYEKFLESIHPDDKNMVHDAYTNSLVTKEPYEIKHRLLMKDGRVKWVVEKCHTIYNHKGEPLVSNGIVQDVTTEHEYLEQHLRMVKQESILKEQSKAASMGSMIANIAHQWRQPLNQITLTVTGILFSYENDIDYPKEKIIKDMNLINDRINYLSENIQTFRNFLKEKKEKKEVVLQDQIDVGLNIISVSLRDNFIKLFNEVDYDSGIKIVMPAGEFSEVIINIINNAKDILLEKKIEDAWVKINMHKDDEKITVTIEDNGGGIPSDILPHIFDDYFTTKDDSKGTGLGLHMSKTIIEDSLNGKLWAENTDNGAKFFIEVPLV